jgi:multiple sugar transport system substrate-binding protein
MDDRFSSIRAGMITRRQFLRHTGAVATMSILAACTPAPSAAPAKPAAVASTPAAPAAPPATPKAGATEAPKPAASTAFDWMRQKGKSIVVSVPQTPYYGVLQTMIPDFQKLSGIEVQFQQVPEQQLRQKVPIELNAKSSGIDVFGTSLHVEKLLFAKAGWYEPLNKYLEDPNLTPPDYNWKDFGSAGTYWVTLNDGAIIATPGSLGLFAFMYRKDTYAEKGLQVPTTVTELQAAVKAAHSPPASYGWVARGLKNANVPMWGMFINALGATYLDPSNTKLMTASPEVVEAARMYTSLLREYGPPGSIGFNWNEAQGFFSQGQAACWTDGLNFAAVLEDPTKSKITGKLGYGLFPGSDKQKPFAGTASDGLALNPFGTNKEAAWLFNAWASSKATQMRMSTEGSMTGTRVSIYDDPEYQKAQKLPKEWIEAVKASGQSGRPQLPEIKEVTQFRDIFGVALVKMIEGGDAKSLLEQATKEFEPILEKSLRE